MNEDLRSYLPDDIADAIERFSVESHPNHNHREAVILILRQWLTQEGFLAKSKEEGTPPNELNATNDD